ncbi:hypothetical protein L218DRAFT_517093 [Marasmius fiardii PR-910]|nr:hypothetical protein L218DRAFT_517093 [Marasmius fiardii PR-910]
MNFDYLNCRDVLFFSGYYTLSGILGDVLISIRADAFYVRSGSDNPCYAALCSPQFSIGFSPRHHFSRRGSVSSVLTLYEQARLTIDSPGQFKDTHPVRLPHSSYSNNKHSLSCGRLLLCLPRLLSTKSDSPNLVLDYRPYTGISCRSFASRYRPLSSCDRLFHHSFYFCLPTRTVLR